MGKSKQSGTEQPLAPPGDGPDCAMYWKCPAGFCN